MRSVEHNAEQIRGNYDAALRGVGESIAELDRSTQQELVTQVQAKLQVVKLTKDALTARTRELERVINEVTEEVESSTKLQVVCRAPEIVKLITDIKLDPAEDLAASVTEVPTDFATSIKPNFVGGTLRISNFASIAADGETGEAVYGDAVSSCGQQWRLKAYPHGVKVAPHPRPAAAPPRSGGRSSQAGRATHLSLYVELVAGPSRAELGVVPLYDWRISLVRARLPLKQRVRAVVDPRIVHQHVHSADPLCRRQHRRSVPHIHRRHPRPPAAGQCRNLLRHRLERTQPPAPQHHLAAAPRQLERNLPAQPAASARHKGHVAVEIRGPPPHFLSGRGWRRWRSCT